MSGTCAERTSLNVLTWNLAMLERSASAPPSWELHDSESVLAATIAEQGSDIVCYQELPGIVPFVGSHDMIRANPRSHSGHLATLVRHELMNPGVRHTTVDGAILTTFEHPAVTIANVHLAPGRAAAADRLGQLADIVGASPTEALVVVGDTNTRLNEIDAVEAAGLCAPKPPRPTWDSRANRFRERGAAFQAYFTRVFVSPGIGVNAVRILDEPVCDRGARFHLSDHYGLAFSFSVR